MITQEEREALFDIGLSDLSQRNSDLAAIDLCEVGVIVLYRLLPSPGADLDIFAKKKRWPRATQKARRVRAGLKQTLANSAYFFRLSRISLRISSSEGPGSAAGASSSFFLVLLTALTSMKTTHAMIRKLMIAMMKRP